MSKSIKVGYVRLRARGSGAWQVDWHDAASGLRQRKTIRATSEADARRQGKALSDAIAGGRFQVSGKTGGGPSVAEALGVAINATGGSRETRANYTYVACQFVAWLATAAPAVGLWQHVTTEHVRAYVLHSQRDTALSDRTVRGRLMMVKLASRYWFQSDPERFRDVAGPVRVKARPGNPIEDRERAQRKALSAADLRAFLTFLETHNPALVGPVMLQALAGLRVREALALRECDVDLSGGTITVTATEGHTPKNASSYRTIPIAPRVLDALRETILALPVGDPERPVFSDEPWPWRETHHRRRLLAAFRLSGIEALRGYVPRNFRASFVTAARSAGVDADTVRAYVGHSAADVLAAAYDQVGLDRLRAVPAALESWHKSGTIERAAPVSHAESGV